jgi:glucosamine--fructose-6-phosphate aminotransferase (isomerizing)
MCGIVGVALKQATARNDIIGMLKRLEYRGYDSWGIATNDGSVSKALGEIPAAPKIEESCSVAILHTRWATHGGVTQQNAHPHVDCTNSLFIVHNGIVENYAELKHALEQNGHTFRSQTDSEVIAHYFEQKLRDGKAIEDAIPDFMATAHGTFAILIMQKGSGKLIALKRDSPLVLGILDDGFVLASDIYAFSNKSNRAIWFENGEFAIVDASGYQFYDSDGRALYKAEQTFEWHEEPQAGAFDHFMIKEIHEIPAVSKRLLLSVKTTQQRKLEELATLIKTSHKVIFVAAGTSYHASLLGVYFLNKIGMEAQTIIASEFKDYAFVDDRTLVIALSQSGETMDVVEALKVAKAKGARIASIVNVPYSTIQRMSELSLDLLAGQEICVAATKSFINQSLLLLAVAAKLGCEADIETAVKDLEHVFDSEDEIRQLAHAIQYAKDLYIIGRGLAYPISREIALKLKEISYIHAEGMMGGELKHGTIALIEPGVPVIGLVDNQEIISNLKEVEARGANVIAISDCETEFEGIWLPVANEPSFALCATVVGQLLTYYIAKEKGLPIDKPRNLAKCCTVK